MKQEKKTTKDSNIPQPGWSQKGKGDWKYGRVEVKARLPKGRGIWPAIWMLPTEWKYGGWPKRGNRYHGICRLYARFRFWNDPYGSLQRRERTAKSKGKFYTDLNTAFHEYAIEWTPEEISFFIDDRLYHVYKNDHRGTASWPFDQSFHLILNVAVGGDWGGKFGVDESVYPQKWK